MTEKVCPLCHSGAIKVIYYGLPFNLCENEECSCLWGFWYFLVGYLPFNGYMFGYSGSYWSAFWCWLFQNKEVI